MYLIGGRFFENVNNFLKIEKFATFQTRFGFNNMELNMRCLIATAISFW